jgi:hypothetical protein
MWDRTEVRLAAIAPLLVKTESVAKGDKNFKKSSGRLAFFLHPGLPVFFATSSVFMVYSHLAFAEA